MQILLWRVQLRTLDLEVFQILTVLVMQQVLVHTGISGYGFDNYLF